MMVVTSFEHDVQGMKLVDHFHKTELGSPTVAAGSALFCTAVV